MGGPPQIIPVLHEVSPSLNLNPNQPFNKGPDCLDAVKKHSRPDCAVLLTCGLPQNNMGILDQGVGARHSIGL